MKLKNIFILGAATVVLTACDDLFEPAIENNHDISDIYSDPQFAGRESCRDPAVVNIQKGFSCQQEKRQNNSEDIDEPFPFVPDQRDIGYEQRRREHQDKRERQQHVISG